jgi:hypothetical protein
MGLRSLFIVALLSRTLRTFVAFRILEPTFRKHNPVTATSSDRLNVGPGNRHNIAKGPNGTTTDSTPLEPACFVVVGNVQSGANIGRIVRSATIFGASECVVVGQVSPDANMMFICKYTHPSEVIGLL